MSQSETIGALVTALVAASGEFDAATKSATNPHFRSKYADLDTVVSATAPALRKHGLAIIQRFTVDDTLQTILVHSSGEWISGEQRLHAAKLDPQGIGSASTYARRYGWMAIIGIAPEDDDGNAGSKPPSAPADAGAAPAAPAGPVRHDGVRIQQVERVPASKPGGKEFWRIHTASGAQCSTFSDTLATAAREAMELGSTVAITVEKNGNFWNLKGIA